MSMDIIIDDWALPEFVAHDREAQKSGIDTEELDKDIQRNREIVKRMRNEEKYKKILQKI